MPAQVLASLTPKDIQNLICALLCNTFGFFNKKLANTHGKHNHGFFSINFCVALALYPSCSYFNHSCVPNCTYLKNGTKLSIRALYDVPKGTELTIHYFELEDGYESRMETLLNNYYFVCQCERCQSKDDEEIQQKILKYLCQVPKCVGFLVCIDPLQPKLRVCTLCGIKNTTL